MINKVEKYMFVLFLLGVLSAAEPIEPNNALNYQWSENPNSNSFGKIGDYGFPSNPMNDRAKGYLLKGKAQAAITNYGRFIDWDYHPAGLWGNYTYLPAVGFVAGIPGQSYSYNYAWTNFEDSGGTCPESNGNYVIWCSNDAYSDPNAINPNFSWIEYGDTNFVSIVFEAFDDRGTLGTQLVSPGDAGEFEVYCDFTGINQFCLDDENNKLIISLPASEQFTVDPNNANAYGDNLSKKSVGLVYPWAKRPDLDQRLEDFDMYKYGPDNEEWTDDDEYVYFGANTAESWFTRWSPSSNTDWHAANKSRENTHNTLVDEGDVFGDINYLDTGTFPLLAHSDNAYTWPTSYNTEGDLVPTWPGWWADTYAPEDTGCFPAKRWNDDCWMVTDRFISDTDIYMEFDDRWAHKGNMVTNNTYEQTGYPMGLKVMAEAHSYGVSFAEDIMFVTVKVRNESGDNWCAYEKDRYGNKVYVVDDNGDLICGDAMIMPDGTKLNRGRGFTYRGTSMGFYMDADVATANKFGSFGVHSNDDDFMEYYDCKNPDLDPDGCDVINDDTLRVSVAMIYDYSFGPPEDIGIVATQLLDSPFATEEVDLNGDGYADLYPGDKLQMTDWHWFDWYNRPGVVFREGDAGCCAGNPGTAQAANKEEIMYKVIAGDTTNLTDDEKLWYFHTPNPSTDAPEELNPHFDSLEGLEQTTFFQDGPAGLDCVLQMSCGPFSLEVGEQVPFSFCIIFGQNNDDLIKNATFAQLMYNSHYQGYTSPDTPTLDYTFGNEINNSEWYGGAHHAIELTWDDRAEKSSDVVTGYADFEGYNIYRSTDGGNTWGDPLTDLYDSNNPDSWVPYAQYHLTSEQDSLHCTFTHDYHGECSISKPEFYVEKDCYTQCLHNEVESQCDLGSSSICDYVSNCYGSSLPGSNDLDSDENYLQCLELFNEKFENCKDSSWNSCASSCSQTTYEDYLSLSDIDQLNYSAIYGIVDCDDPIWGGDNDDVPDIRGYNICGYDPHNLIKGDSALGQCGEKESVSDPYCSNDVFKSCSENADCIEGTCITEKEVGIKRTFIDNNVIDGYEYTYAITAFDMGIAPDFITTYNEDLGILQETSNTANPLHFASPDGYQSIEVGRGRTSNDKNYVTVISGPKATESLSNEILVVPNPYIASSNYNETEYKRKIWFFDVPDNYTLTIFTITGEKVVTIDSNDAPIDEEGKVSWDLRTVNNQEVAPGLYVFAVENRSPGFEGQKFVGKFAIVR